MQAVLFAAVQLIDAVFLGKIDNAENVQSGLNAVSNISFNISTLATAMITGIGVFIMQYNAKKDKDMVQKLFRLKIVVSLLISCIILVPAVLFLKQISSLWINSDDLTEYNSTLNFAKSYGEIIIPLLFVDFIIISISSTFNDLKYIKITVFVSLITLLMNMSLNYPFIYTMGFGVRGSAYATIISKITALILWIFLIFRYRAKENPISIPPLFTWLSVNILKYTDVLKKSSVWALTSFFAVLAFTLQIMLISKTASYAGAALMAAGSISQFVEAFTKGTGTGVRITVMYQVGHGETNFKKIASNMSKIPFAFGIAIGALVIAAAPMSRFVYDFSSDVHDEIFLMLLSIGLTVPARLTAQMYLSLLNGGGKSKGTFAITTFQSYCITLLTTYFLITYSTLSIGSVYCVVTVLSYIYLLLLFVYFSKTHSTLKPLSKDVDKTTVIAK